MSCFCVFMLLLEVLTLKYLIKWLYYYYFDQVVICKISLGKVTEVPKKTAVETVRCVLRHRGAHRFEFPYSCKFTSMIHLKWIMSDNHSLSHDSVMRWTDGRRPLDDSNVSVQVFHQQLNLSWDRKEKNTVQGRTYSVMMDFSVFKGLVWAVRVLVYLSVSALR